jgi:cytochrome b involved in lipid metabolism
MIAHPIALPIANRKPEDFYGVLSRTDIAIMNATRDYPDYITSMEKIMGYVKTRLVETIDVNVVKHFRNCGVERFGSSVKDFRYQITKFLEEHPACKDSDPTRCLNKVLYWLSRDWHESSKE